MSPPSSSDPTSNLNLKSRPASQLSETVTLRAGARLFFLAVVLAGIFGLGLRINFHPARIQKWVEKTVQTQFPESGLKFRRARLVLARGMQPTILVELNDVELNPPVTCQSGPSVTAAKVFLPLDLGQLISGRVALGAVGAEDVTIDVDGLKSRCDGGRSAPGRMNNVPPNASSPLGSSSASPNHHAGVDREPWWRPEPFKIFQAKVKGIELTRVRFLFENSQNAKKEVQFHAFHLEAVPSPQAIRIRSQLVLPPDLTLGESLPLFSLTADVRPTEADIKLSADLSEGRFQANGHLTKDAGAGVWVELRSDVDELPLSGLGPLLAKTGIVEGPFHPKFLWLNCHASINGHLQGLFDKNPLRFSDCEVVGKGVRIKVAQAVRLPGGRWEPVTLALEKVEIAQILETFAWKGPDGVFSDFGKFTGEIQLVRAGASERDSMRLVGEVEGSLIHFSNWNARAPQKVSRFALEITRSDGRLQGRIDDIRLEDGIMEARLDFDLGERLDAGSAHAVVQKFILSDSVQRVLVGGKITLRDADLRLRIERRELAAISGSLLAESDFGHQFRFENASVKIETGKDDGVINLSITAPQAEFAQEAPFFRGLKAAFLGHRFKDEWVKILEPQIRLRASRETSGGFQWDGAQGLLENRRIRVTSAGRFVRAEEEQPARRRTQDELKGWVGIDFPRARSLRWTFGGSAEKPTLTPDSGALRDLLDQQGRQKTSIDDQRLGLIGSQSDL